MQANEFQSMLIARELAREMEAMSMVQNSQFEVEPIAPHSDQERWAAIAAFTGLSLMSAVTFVAGYDALSAEAPVTWSHGLMALSIGQIGILGGISFKMYRLLQRNRSSVAKAQTGARRRLAHAPARSPVMVPSPVAVIGTPTDLPRAFIAGREYVTYPDGSVELDTLLGRRLFTSIDAAREFVGG